MQKLKTKTKYFLLGLFFLVVPIFAVASDEEGVIDDAYRYIWSENVGWIDFGAENGNVVVTDDELTGYAYGENIGWISLNCSNDNSCSNADFKVSNDGEGNLSGYGWGENVGWIDFGPAGSGVTIDSDGSFSGYAYGENIGWLSFNCENSDSCNSVNFKLATDWQSEQERESDLEIDDVECKKTDTTITIKWETNSDANSRVRYGENRNLENEEKDSEKEENHKIKLKNLKPDTKYYFRIKSTDENGNSDRSKIYSVKTKEAENIFQALIPSGYEKADEKEELEDLQIDVSDKIEDSGQEALNQQEGFKSGDIDLQNGGSTSEMEVEPLRSQKESKIKNFFASIKNGLVGFQNKIASVFSGKKEKTKEYFTTRIAQVDNKKIVKDIKFQILDKGENPIPSLETTLFSDPQTTVTDENGIASFKDVPVGDHTLAFNHNNEEFKKDIAIQDTQTGEGVIRAEVIQVKAAKDKISSWMWLIILAIILLLGSTIYFGKKYYELKKHNEGDVN